MFICEDGFIELYDADNPKEGMCFDELKLSDVLRAVGRVEDDIVRLGRVVTVVDVNTYRSYAQGFGAFYLDQVMNAEILLVSKIEAAADGSAAEASSADLLPETVLLLGERNPRAEIVAVPWESGEFRSFLSDFGDPSAVAPHLPGMRKVGEHHPARNAGDGGFSSISFEFDTSTTAGEISRRVGEILLDSETPGAGMILRIKGILATSDRGTVRVDWAGGILSLEPTEAAPDNRLLIILKGVRPDLTEEHRSR
jgi:G3E family GTPase